MHTCIFYHIWMYICSPKTCPKWDQRLNRILQLDQQGCYRCKNFPTRRHRPSNISRQREWGMEGCMDFFGVGKNSRNFWDIGNMWNVWKQFLCHPYSYFFPTFVFFTAWRSRLLSNCFFPPSQLLDMLFLFVFCGGGESHFDWDAEVQKYLAVSKVSL